MGEDIYRLISTGLLAVIVLLLLLAVSQLGKLRGALRAGPASDASEPQEDAPAAEEPHPVVPAEDTAVVETTQPERRSEPDPDEEGPYERDGRWWFRRDGELLVYDEQKEQWIDPAAVQPEPAVAAQPEPEPHPLDEARDWVGPTDSDAPGDPAPAPVVEPAPIASAEPVAAPEPVVSAAPVTAPEPVAVPTPEPVDAPAPIAQGTETQESAPGGSAAHWKCPACGVINGSTATSCRMCFSARP